MMSTEYIQIEFPSQQIAIIKINRENEKNALNYNLIEKISKEIKLLNANDTIRVIIITGVGRFFALALETEDLKQLSRAERPPSNVWPTLRDSSKPIIAAVNGYALGAGLELALACDIIIADNTAKFALPEITMGIMPGGGGTQRLTRSIGKYRSMLQIMTGDFFDVREAHEMGIISEITENGKSTSRAIEIAYQLAEKKPKAIELIKKAILAADETPIQMGLEIEKDNFYELLKDLS